MERADLVLPGAETDRMMPHPLRVLIDARMLIGRFSGVSRFVTRLVDELARRDDLRDHVHDGQHWPLPGP